MSKAPQSRPGRYAELDTDQLADAVERAYDRGEHPDWELVFELARRAMAVESTGEESDVRAAQSA